jgi:acetyl-CoA synthetase
MLAAMKLGVVVIPATTLLTGDELCDRVERGRAKMIITDEQQVAKCEALPREGVVFVNTCPDKIDGWQSLSDAYTCPAEFEPDGPTNADDPMLLYFTSGTTAKPKLVRHSHRSYPIGALSTMYWLGLKPGDVHVNISSPGWAKHAWSTFFAPWNAGATVLMVNQAPFNAKGLLGVLERCKVTTFCAPPTVWRLLIQEDLKAYKLSLREVCGAGEPLNPEVISQVQEAWSLTIRDGYGQTETTAQVANPPGMKVKAGSMGRPLPGYRVLLLDVDGKPAKEGEISLALGADRPAGLMQGYADASGKLAGADGEVYRTGDVASLDADGYLTFVGRADDVFKSSDYRISPFELESVLIEHDAVAEAAIVPSPDEIRLSVPKAFILLAGTSLPSKETAASILNYTNTKLAPFKRIRRLEFVKELPKTISGKIRRNQLRKVEYEGSAADVVRGVEFHEKDVLGG